MERFGHGIAALDAERTTLYVPKQRPGFVAWASAFTFPDGRIGLSFKETVRGKDPAYRAPKLELGEAVGAPVSYCSVECGSETERSYRVYGVSSDGGKTFHETGRCPLDEGAFCNVGLRDGTLIGYDVARVNAAGTGWCEFIRVSRSTDGGTTWETAAHLLDGTAPYLWRVRTLRDGTILLLLSLYGTPWGEGKARTTRNTMLPGETYQNKIQTCFLSGTDGVHFSGPHYVLPGIGAHEYDVAECADGRLLFLAGDVQATPVGRQFVTRQGDAYINGTLYGIKRGAPTNPQRDKQGGFVPESVVMLENDLLVGSRRGKPYSASNDYGENWYEIDGLPHSLYQPFMIAQSDQTVLNFGHVGGDDAFGQQDMVIGVDRFRVENHLPEACALTLSRDMDAAHKQYQNAYSARLTVGEEAAVGEAVCFRASSFWNADGTVNTAPQDDAPYQICAVTDENGVATARFPMFDNIPDIHFYYNIDVVFRPKHTGKAPCDGPMMCEAAMTPRRFCRYPYETYLAGGKLYLSPDFLARFPNAITLLEPLYGGDGVADGVLPEDLIEALEKTRVLQKTDAGLLWYKSTHAEKPLLEAAPMGSGDWYE